MKLTIILLTAAFLNVSARSVSQTVNFSGKDLPLEKVFSIVQEQTHYNFFYKASLLKGLKPVSIKAENVLLEDFLTELLKDQPLKFIIENKNVVISRKVLEEIDLKSAAGNFASSINIKGRVLNENNEPLAGASVSVKGTNIVTMADANGYYTIENIPAGEYTLLISYVGYATKTATVKVTENDAVDFNFTLTPSLINLDAFTVAGTLSKRKIRAYPATIAEIKGPELQNRNLNNIANILEALPGVVIQPGNEGLNSGSSRTPVLLIRGTQAGVKYIIDGVETVPGSEALGILQTLDPNNIEKIEVLKGPMASTLYGSGAGGGIIAITTKKGKPGKTKVNFKTMFTQYANDYANYSGYSQDYSVNVSGGSEQFNYLLGANYNLYPTTKLTDINNGIDDKTHSYTAKFSGKSKSISVDLSLQYGTKTSGAGSTAISDNKFRESLGLSTTPPFALIDYKSSQRSFATALHLTHFLTDKWYQDITLGYDIQNNVSSTYTANNSGTFDNTELLYSKMNVRYFMFYDHPWSSVLKSSITAGAEYVGYETRYMYLGSISPSRDFFSSYTAALEGSASFTKSPYSSIGYFAEVVTSLKNNLFLTTGIRLDENNAYGQHVHAYPQPRVGLSYVIETGNFRIKPRIVWGVSSDAPDPTYKVSYVQSYSYATYIYPGNPDIKPTRSEGYEFGADIFYGNNYSLNLTYYDQKLKDMIQPSYLVDQTTNPLTFTTYYYNIAKAINRGLEVSAKAVFNPLTIDLSYSASVNKWGKDIGQASTAIIYPGAPLSNVPKRSAFARMTYTVPSFLSWTKKGGKISLDWRYNGSSYYFDNISYSIDYDKYLADPVNNTYPDYYSYNVWLKGYSYLNLRMDYSVTNFAAVYIDIQNLLDKQGSPNGQLLTRFPGRRFNFGVNVNF